MLTSAISPSAEKGGRRLSNPQLARESVQRATVTVTYS